MGIRESWWDPARFETQGSNHDLHPYILGLEQCVLGKNPTWRRINLSRKFIPPPGWGRRIEQLGQEGQKKPPKIGCFAKAVPDLRVTEQGQEAEAGAGEGKCDTRILGSSPA